MGSLYLSWQCAIRFDGGKGIGLRRCRLDWYVSSYLFNCFRGLTMSFLWRWREIGSLFSQTMAGNHVMMLKFCVVNLFSLIVGLLYFIVWYV
jgi:hypothetical protein